MKIVVISNGFILVCRDYSCDADAATLITARCIRVWGTSEGLGQLVGGPTSDTVLDATIPVVSVPRHQIIFTFDVIEAKWDAHLK